MHITDVDRHWQEYHPNKGLPFSAEKVIVTFNTSQLEERNFYLTVVDEKVEGVSRSEVDTRLRL